MWINEIKSDSKSIDFIARVEKVSVSTGNNGANYLIIYLVDKTGRIEARLWNCDPEDEEIIKEGSIIKVEGLISLYRKQLQLKISKYHIIVEEEFNKYGIDQSDFFISAPLNIDKHYNWLIKTIEELKNPIYKKITLKIIKDNEKKFKTYPAATSIHHNVLGGLFWHSFSLLKGAISLKDIYKYANVDWELVYCGAVLHDIGKIVEMKGKNASDYTDEGKLLGHITIGSAFISHASNSLKLSEKEYEESVKLQHIVLSSHGKHEFGSPVEPSMLEAIIVSSLDALDARIYKVNEELSKVDGEGWTGRILTEGGRAFLKHHKKK
ncbi:3'-5' exoribonuclease YhaM family protein [Spiroplasma tabanidicola]|uniref:3'-5' exoribonuclease n=1 Tax=Spiroplasma tabanidicola TaxID=324079 RepID=A0A6I6CDL1_9MOLU|nr:HD domain-containing protein [Spiroplasma tabanidicola]QGS52202.1 3'-5' exoribonuclease [Spiroplasma tabanidicola]